MFQGRYDPEYWRERAEKARAAAESMKNEVSRQFLLSIAHSYDIIAERAAQRRIGQV